MVLMSLIFLSIFKTEILAWNFSLFYENNSPLQKKANILFAPF